jgi:hypothetical protein
VTITSTPTLTPTNTPTGTANVTPTPTNTGTPNPTTTPTNTGTPTVTPTNTPTNTLTPTNTGTPQPTPTPTATPPPPVQYVSMGIGTDKLIYSRDAVTWLGSTNGNSIITGTSIGRVKFNNGVWMAGYGSNYKIAYSTDGITWTNSINGNSIFGGTVRDLVYGDSKWVGVADASGKMGYSTDNGANWSLSSNGNVVIGGAYGVDYDGTRFIAAGEVGALNALASSYDGITWTGNSALNGILTDIRAISYGGGKWIVGNINPSEPAIAYSTNDGTSWTVVAGTPLQSVNNLFWNGSVWVAAGDNTVSNQSLMISTDGITWTLPSVGSNIFTTQGFTVTYSNNRWLAGGSSASEDMATSLDNGDTWTGINIPIQSTIIYSIASKPEYKLLAESDDNLQSENSEDINIEN